jgi:hypothetical protein
MNASAKALNSPDWPAPPVAIFSLIGPSVPYMSAGSISGEANLRLILIDAMIRLAWIVDHGENVKLTS